VSKYMERRKGWRSKEEAKNWLQEKSTSFVARCGV
jgi:hypothetical protein